MLASAVEASIVSCAEVVSKMQGISRLDTEQLYISVHEFKDDWQRLKCSSGFDLVVVILVHLVVRVLRRAYPARKDAVCKAAACSVFVT